MKYSKICWLFLVSILFSGIGLNYGLGINTDTLALRRAKGGGGDSITKIASLLTGNTFNLIVPYLNNLPVGYNLHKSADLIRFISDSADFFNQNTPDTGYMDRFVTDYVQAKIKAMNLPANELSEQDIAKIINGVFDDDFFNALPPLEFLDDLNKMSQVFPEVKDYLGNNNFIPPDFFSANGAINLPSNMTSEDLSQFVNKLYDNESLRAFLDNCVDNFINGFNPADYFIKSDLDFKKLETTIEHKLNEIIAVLESAVRERYIFRILKVVDELARIAPLVEKLRLAELMYGPSIQTKRYEDARLMAEILPGFIKSGNDAFRDEISALRELTDRVRSALDKRGGSYAITDIELSVLFLTLRAGLIRESLEDEESLSRLLPMLKLGLIPTSLRDEKATLEKRARRLEAIAELSKITGVQPVWMSQEMTADGYLLLMPAVPGYVPWHDEEGNPIDIGGGPQLTKYIAEKALKLAALAGVIGWSKDILPKGLIKLIELEDMLMGIMETTLTHPLFPLLDRELVALITKVLERRPSRIARINQEALEEWLQGLRDSGIDLGNIFVRFSLPFMPDMVNPNEIDRFINEFNDLNFRDYPEISRFIEMRTNDPDYYNLQGPQRLAFVFNAVDFLALIREYINDFGNDWWPGP